MKYSLKDWVAMTLFAQALIIGCVFSFRGCGDIMGSFYGYRTSGEPQQRGMLVAMSDICEAQKAHKAKHGRYGELDELDRIPRLYEEEGERQAAGYRVVINLEDGGAEYELYALPKSERLNSYYIDPNGSWRWARRGPADGNSPVIMDLDQAAYGRRPLPLTRVIIGLAIMLATGIAFFRWRKSGQSSPGEQEGMAPRP